MMSIQIEHDARAWIFGYLREEGGVVEPIDEDRAIFEYLDSFGVIGFFMACEKRYPIIGDIDPAFFTGVSLNEAARLIAQKLESVAKLASVAT